MGAAAELALQRTGGSAALLAPPPLQEATVRAVLGLQPPPSASAACARGHLRAPRGAPHRAAAPLWRRALPQPPPKGPSGKHRLRCTPPVLLVPVTPNPLQGGLAGERSACGGSPGSGCGWRLRSLRAAPWLSFLPPAHPAPSPCSPPAAKSARLPSAARGASAPLPPGAPRRQKTPARPGGMKV
jgi:hypothetical protein